jgi:hypothetical protein
MRPPRFSALRVRASGIGFRERLLFGAAATIGIALTASLALAADDTYMQFKPKGSTGSSQTHKNNIELQGESQFGTNGKGSIGSQNSGDPGKSNIGTQHLK